MFIACGGRTTRKAEAEDAGERGDAGHTAGEKGQRDTDST